MPESGSQLIHFVGAKASLTNRRQLKNFLVQLVRKEGFNLKSISYIFCSDDYLLELNRDFLNHNTLTDIITFPFSEKGQPLESEIYISLDRVRENAGLFN